MRGRPGSNHSQGATIVIGNEQGRSKPIFQAQPTPAWQWLLLLGGFGLIFWLFAPKRVGPQPAEPASLIWVLSFLWVVSIVILSRVAWKVLRNFDRGVRRAQKLAQELTLTARSPTCASRSKRKGRRKTVSTRWDCFS